MLVGQNNCIKIKLLYNRWTSNIKVKGVNVNKGRKCRRQSDKDLIFYVCTGVWWRAGGWWGVWCGDRCRTGVVWCSVWSGERCHVGWVGQGTLGVSVLSGWMCNRLSEMALGCTVCLSFIWLLCLVSSIWSVFPLCSCVCLLFYRIVVSQLYSWGLWNDGIVKVHRILILRYPVHSFWYVHETGLRKGGQFVRRIFSNSLYMLNDKRLVYFICLGMGRGDG
jgi:hypothetical protein